MPTYQYACTDCGHAFDQVQSFSDDALTMCPECEGRLRKLFNAVGVVFKGSGFYRTDSRGKAPAESGTPAAASSSSSSSDTSSTSTTTSEGSPKSNGSGSSSGSSSASTKTSSSPQPAAS